LSRLTSTRSIAQGVPLGVLFILVHGGTGCRSPDPGSLSSFKHGLSVVGEQSIALFRDVNDVSRQAQLDRVETQTMLKESDVAPALDAESIGRWNRGIEALSAYASSLEVLSSPEHGEGIEKSVEGLGGRITALAAAPPENADEVTKAIGHLGKLIVNARAGAAALEVMQKADRDVRSVLTHMGSMIGDGPTEGGVRTTVFSNWTTLADGTRAQFPQAAPSEKRSIAEKYADELRARAAADAALAAVRKSLLDLADVHTAASQGRTADASEMVAFLREEIAFAGELLKSAREHEGSTP
jgi:hypothetical protein